MAPITLKNSTESGQKLEAVFVPEKGMNMNSFKCGSIEVIDQSTKEQFEKKFAGLGALIGPHFHRRQPHLIAKNIDEKKFPHSAYFTNDAHPDPFSHGIGRYAPWNATFTDTSFKASLSGKETWGGVPLSLLEGQNFKLNFNGKLTSSGLELELSVVSDSDSLVGIHYYYALPEGKGTVISKVQNSYIEAGEKKPLPQQWNIDSQNSLSYPLEADTDFTFFPYPDPLKGTITLKTATHQLITSYQCDSAENSWQLWHPKGASFVCIEPVSSQDPRHPNLTVSSIRIHLQIVLND
jgi:hypothetical protein